MLALNIGCMASTPMQELYENSLLEGEAKVANCKCLDEVPEANLSRWRPLQMIAYAYNYFSTYVSDAYWPKFDKQIKKDFVMVPVSSYNLKNMHKASTLLISCIDFRLRDETGWLMEEVLGLTDEYDEVAIPGAALAFLQTKHYEHWAKTLKDIVGLAKDLHGIERVIFLDHRGCGAYEKILGEDSISTPEKETKTHTEVFKKTRKNFAKEFPDLKVYTFLMGLDGKVEIIKG